VTDKRKGWRVVNERGEQAKILVTGAASADANANLCVTHLIPDASPNDPVEITKRGMPFDQAFALGEEFAREHGWKPIEG
jgi:hypothetical protein